MGEIIEKVIESVFKRTHLALIVLGFLWVVLIVVAGAIGIPWFGGKRISLTWPLMLFLGIIAVPLFVVGLKGAWLRMRCEAASLGQDSATPLPLGSNGRTTDDPARQTIECRGTLVDSYLGDSGTIVEMPLPRRWTYQLKDAKLEIGRDEISLQFQALVKSPHSEATEVYRSCGSGPFIDGVGYLIYSFTQADGGNTTWQGVMVLRVPRRGKITGFWLTTNVNKGDEFPLGAITLMRRS